jgi:SAM-dependent methyltransferase
MEDHTPDDEIRARTSRNYWIAASKQDGVLSVNPGGRWASMHDWTRRALQRWTLARMSRIKPRFQRCLDIGCGYGDWTELFAAISDEVYAFDIAPAFVERARKRVPGARIECSDLRSYRMPEQLDLVYIGAVLLYVSEPEALDLLRRVRAAVAPGALVVWREFATFNFGRRTVNASDDRFSIHRTPEELAWLAELAGFTLVEQRAAPSIYGEVLGGRYAGWALRGLMRFGTSWWRRASRTLLLRPV